METTGNFNCGKYRISINENGVSVWDTKKQQWIIDASTIAKDHIFYIGTGPYNTAHEIDTDGINRVFATQYYRKKSKTGRDRTPR